MNSKEELSTSSRSWNSSVELIWVEVDLPLADKAGAKTRSPTLRPSGGGATVEARAVKPALGDSWESLMQPIIDDVNIEKPEKNVKANRGTPGPDGITITQFPVWYRAR